jgi:FKBP-type peptidyl-prolyl cis-trans isomerase 2
MQVGDKRDVVIQPEDAYGPYVEELVKVLPRSAFPPNINPAIGFEFGVQLQSGESIPVRIIDIEGDEITIDANHLLAGETLFFNIELVSIDKPVSTIIS